MAFVLSQVRLPPRMQFACLQLICTLQTWTTLSEVNWPEGRDFGASPEEVAHAQVAPPYNELSEDERHYALFTDGSCCVVGNHRK